MHIWNFSIDSTCRYVVFKSISIAFQPLVFKTKFRLINMSMPKKNAHIRLKSKKGRKSQYVCWMKRKKRSQAEKFVSSYRFNFNDLLDEKIGDHVSFFAIQKKKILGDNKLTWNVKMVMKKVGDFGVLFFWFLMSGIERRYIMYRTSDCSDRFWVTFRDNKFIST